MSILSRGSAAPAAALLAAVSFGAWILVQDAPAEVPTQAPPALDASPAARPAPARLRGQAPPVAAVAVEAVHRQPEPEREPQPRAVTGDERASPTAAMILELVDSGRIAVSPGILRADLHPIAEKAVRCGVHPDRLRRIRLEPPDSKAHVRLCATTDSAVGRTAWLLRHERLEWRLVGRSRW